jgi:hypothetical protein
MIKNAVFFNNVYNAANPVNNTQCITYNPNVGFEFINNGEVISVIAKDKSPKKEVNITVKPAEFKALKKDVITIKDELQQLKDKVDTLLYDKISANSDEINL